LKEIEVMENSIQFALKLNIHGHAMETPFEKFVHLAKTADQLGYDGLFIIDHLFIPGRRAAAYSEKADPERPYFLDCWTALAALARETKRVRLGPQVTPLTLRHPIFVAKMAAAIDIMSEGRMVLGVGSGWNKEEFEAYGFSFLPTFKERNEQLREGVEIIHRLWTEDRPVNYPGKYYRMKDAPFWPKPVQKPRPPIWFGGSSRSIQRLAAKLGEGWCPAAPQAQGLTPEVYREGLTEIQKFRAEANRTEEPFTPGILFFTSIAKDDRTARSRVEKILSRRSDWAEFSLDTMQERGIIIAGDPSRIRDAIQRYIEAGVRYFTPSFIPTSDLEATEKGLELYANEVIAKL
jgi:probable F420-dependent oxidoreductase